MYIALFPSYILWHYSRGIVDIFRVLRNLLRAILRIFSLKLLLMTLFAPFERLGETYDGRNKMHAWVETFVVNTLMRIVGCIVRLSVILVGSMTIVLWFGISIAALCIWILLPGILLGLVYVGLFNIFKAIA